MWWVNGEVTSQVSAADRGLAYGDGIFETMRLVESGIPMLAAHLHRLSSGADRLKIPLEIQRCEQAIEIACDWAHAQGYEQAVIKLILTRSGGVAGYRPSASSGANILIHATELLMPQSALKVRVKLCDYKLGSLPQLAGMKHLNRLEQVLASQQLDDEEEGLLLDQNSNIAEGISHNFFFVKGSEIATPRMTDCGVWGVMRHFLLENVHKIAGLKIVERDISISELKNADEMLLTNAVRGVRNIASITNIWQHRAEQYGQPVGDRLRAFLRENLAADFVSC